jgi:two-component system chemotaxis response regulator CheB
MKILVVDDSALMRKYLAEILEGGLDAEIMTARDGAEALAKVREWNPDVVTLDINMPVMDGLTCLSHIMTESPRPVVMVSSLTDREALATLEALAMGAADYVTKPGGTVSLNIKQAGAEIVAKVRAAARHGRINKLRRRPAPQPVERPARPRPPANRSAPSAGQRPSSAVKLVMVGVSTGGPSTLEEILPLLPASFPVPVLVAQHMPAAFTRVFAARLDSICALRVEEVQHRTKLEAGHIYVAQGDADVEVWRAGIGPVAVRVPEHEEMLWHPSVDHLVTTAAREMDPKALVGVLLTGMGDDGAKAMTEMHTRGGRTIAESEETAVIFGMPAELIAAGGADVVLPCGAIASQLIKWVC